MLRSTSAFFLQVRFAALLMLYLTLAGSAAAQFGASIAGNVTDQSGAAVTGANVTVTNKATGIAVTTVTSDSGAYRVSGLAPGTYAVSVEASSFKKNVSDNVEVKAETVRGLDVVLQAGAVSETVEVLAQAETLQTETATVSGTISTREILNLPQFGRDPYDLVRLTPGIFGDAGRTGAGQARNLPQQVGPGGSNNQVFQVENQIQVTANGQRVTANNIALDGVSVNSLDWGGAAVLTPNQESVAETTVVTSTFSAEDGRNSGAQIKVISKSGTNDFHGSAFIKFNDKGLNAFNKFYGPTNVPLNTITCEVGTPDEFTITASRCPERVNQKYRQFGGSFGGPIIKEKLFFFFSYEGVRRNDTRLARDVKLEAPAFQQYVIATNPGSIAAQIFSTPGIEARIVNTTSETDCCSLDGRPLGTWYQPGIGIGQAIGNGPDGIPDWGLYDLRIPGNATGDQFNGRVDYRRGSNQFFFGMYYTRRDDLQGGQRPLEDVVFQPKNWTGTVGWTRTFSTTVLNEARANVTRWAFDQLEVTGQTNYGIPQIRLFDFDAGGLGDPGRIIGLARSQTVPAKLAQNTLAFRDTLFWTRGRHQFKFGGEFRYEQNNNDLRGGYRPDYQFRGLLNLANDACCFFEAVSIDPNTGGVPNGLRHFRTGAWAAFVQDDWKIRPSLTINLGLRWEYFPPLTETDDVMTNYIFGSQGFIDGTVQPVTELFNPDRNNFSPRIGFAWAPGGSNNLVFRGGFALNYNRHFGVTFSNIRQNTPFFADANICCFFDPGVIVGPPPGSNMQYNLGTSTSAFSYPANPNLAFGVAPDGALCGDALCATITRVDLFGALPDEPNPYVYSFTGEMQYEPVRNIAVILGYYGNRSRKLIRTIDLNRIIPGDNFDASPFDRIQSASADGTPCGPGNPACPAPVQIGNPRFGRIFFPLPDVNASFDSLVATVRHRAAHGLDFSATYTWSHAIDTSSYEIGFQQTDPSDQTIEKAKADFDVRHNLVMAAVWDLPFLRGRKDALGRVLGGWTISGIFSTHSGFPFSALLGSCDPARDRNGDGYCPDLPFVYAGGIIESPSKEQWINGVFPDPASSFPGAQFIPDPSTRGPGCHCRNIFSGPGYTSLDLTVGKQFGLPNMPFLGESAKLDFRANFFNALNTLNLAHFTPATAPTDIINTGQFGRSQNGLAGRVIEFQVRFSF
ncbi:MAG: TonB-dependent receptor [Acidobacteria bacterium]|nr:TonB-dependent receptor [Acidobacteriota bacterium]